MTEMMMSRLSRSFASLALLTMATAACSKDVEQAKREYVERGNRYMNDRNVEAAIIEYRNAVQQDPRFGDAYRKLAAAHLLRGDAKEAVRAAVTAADLLPNVPEAQVEAGSLLLLAGGFEQAKQYAQKVVAANPQDARAHVLLGNAIAGLKDVDAAIKEFEEATRLDPREAAVYTGLAALKAKSGSGNEAEATFQKAIALNPKSTNARLALAQYYWSVDRGDAAEVALKGAHAIEPADVRVNITLAMFYQATGRPGDAEPYLRAAATTSQEPRLTLTLADYYIARHRPGEAKTLLEPLASDRRVGTLASLRLAGIAQMQGRPDEALAIVDRAMASDPYKARTLAAKSDLLLRQQKIEEASEAAAAAVKANASSAEAQFVHGRVLRAKGDFDKAEAAFNEVLRLNPRAAAARVELAQLRVRERADDSIVVAAEAANADPSSVDARLTLARAFVQKRQFERAREILAPLVAAAPAVPAVHAQMGSVLAAKKDFAGARAAFVRALELDPVQLEAAGGLTTLDFAAGDRKGALDRLDAMVARDGRNKRILLMAANAHASAANFPRAESLLLTAIDLDPALMNAYTLLGQIYMTQKRLDAARAQFDTIARQQERPVGVLTLIGTIDMLQNRTADAQQTFERVLQLDANAGVAANNLAWIYLEHGGNTDAAVRLAQTARAAFPQSAEVHDTLGWAYFKKGQLADAVASLRRSYELDPRNSTTLYHLALAYDRHGDRDDARKAMTRYLQVDPSSDRSADLRQRLQSLLP
jgi:tetratricopeptide (TPR) repeat protein